MRRARRARFQRRDRALACRRAVSPRRLLNVRLCASGKELVVVSQPGPGAA